MYNRNKKTNIRPFKSHTDINNYNNFLLELDKKQTKNKNIDETLKNISKSYINDTSAKTTSAKTTSAKTTSAKTTSANAITAKYDPNLYDPNINDPNINDPNINDPNINDPNINDTKLDNIEKNNVHISIEINNINDLLLLIEKYPLDKHIEYNINMVALHKIKEPLTELNNMIGMKNLKENIVDQIIFYIQNLHTLKSDIKGNDFMHTVIYGSPGTGKTEIAKIIGSIFSKLGVLSKGTFKKVTRADLIAGYLGQTALKTRDVIKECLGGVLFIDEAYALGNEEKRDSFSKECIDTLCEALSDHKDNLMVIIAGYETDLNSCFFNYNQGLKSRFTWRFKTDDYSGEDLYNIFIKKINDGGWHLSENSEIDVKWFKQNKHIFKFYGRDIETLFAKTKIAHSRRVFCLESSLKKYLTIKDLDKGLEIYLKNENLNEKEGENKINKIITSMYV
jgi:ATP-dependent 26S proteasome regulatory subunit